MNKKVVYTSIFGDYEPLKELKSKYKENDIDYICFTDCEKILNSKEAKNWKIIKIDIPKPINWDDNYDEWDGHYKNREIKINIEKYLGEYDYSLYIDGSFKIINCVGDFFNEFIESEYNIFIPKHPKYNCIYKEAKQLIKHKYDRKLRINNLIKFYKNEKFPRDYGLGENGFCFRKHNSSTYKLMEQWLKIVYTKCRRDQMSLLYCSWKYNIPIFCFESKKRAEYVKFYGGKWSRIRGFHQAKKFD